MNANLINKVHDYQRKLNMEPRNDSKLTERFANGTLEGDWTVEKVAKELVAVEYIFKKTLYGELQEEYMRIVAKKLRNMYKLNWTDTWAIVRFYAPDALKLQCLLATGQKIPEALDAPEEDNVE